MPVVAKNGGFDRTCIIIDLCTKEPMTPVQITQIEDQMELVLERNKTIYKFDVVGPHRFITPLKMALRLE
jgi:hypothetical protein